MSKNEQINTQENQTKKNPIVNLFSKIVAFFVAIPGFFMKTPEYFKSFGLGVKDFFVGLFSKKASLDARKARAGYLFVLPFILGVLLIYLPILIDSIYFSFADVTFEPGGTDIVLEYVDPLYQYYAQAFETETFTVKLLSSVQQLILEVPAIIVFSLFIAVVLNQKMLGRAAFRAIFFVPVIIATGIMESIDASDIMKGSAGSGIDNGSGSSGGTEIISMLDVQALFKSMKIGGELVEYVVQIVNNVYSIINYSGVQMLIFLAGLQSISPSIYEACRIDGATGWETFWKVTFPMISPMILVNAVYTIIDSFTRATNPMITFLKDFAGSDSQEVAMYWIYFVIVMLIIGVFALIASSFVFYQRRD